MSLETSETELPKRKKATIKPKAKPVSDKHAVMGSRALFTIDDVIRFIGETTDKNLSEIHSAVALEVTGRHQRIREELEAKAAAIGATVKWPGTRKGEAIPPRYRDPNTGETWAKRGVMPNWLKAHVDAGRDIEEFAV